MSINANKDIMKANENSKKDMNFKKTIIENEIKQLDNKIEQLKRQMCYEQYQNEVQNVIVRNDLIAKYPHLFLHLNEM